jgi:hypothetical protein
MRTTNAEIELIVTTTEKPEHLSNYASTGLREPDMHQYKIALEVTPRSLLVRAMPATASLAQSPMTLMEIIGSFPNLMADERLFSWVLACQGLSFHEKVTIRGLS